MTKGFVNLNRFRHDRAIKRDTKRKADLQSKTKTRDKVLKYDAVTRLNEPAGQKKRFAALTHITR